MWSGIMWLRIRTISGFHNILEISWIAQKLAVSHGELNSVGSVTNYFGLQGTDDNERNNLVIRVSLETRMSRVRKKVSQTWTH
jgi:hypothetical protein